jgi:hypothetical protein
VRKVALCGTDSGYSRHRRRGEQPCQPCTRAHSADGQTRKRRQAAAAIAAGTHRMESVGAFTGWPSRRRAARSYPNMENLIPDDRWYEGSRNGPLTGTERFYPLPVDYPKNAPTLDGRMRPGGHLAAPSRSNAGAACS